MMLNQDDIDTAPVIFRDGTRVEFQATTAIPGERVELVLEPSSEMKDPTLFMSLHPRDDQVVVENIACGPITIVAQESAAENYRFGRRLDATVSKQEPIKILISNRGSSGVKIGASLVVSEGSPGTYRQNGEG
jgi:hypothetical protein